MKRKDWEFRPIAEYELPNPENPFVFVGDVSQEVVNENEATGDLIVQPRRYATHVIYHKNPDMDTLLPSKPKPGILIPA